MTAAQPGSNSSHAQTVGALAEEAGQLLDVVAAKLAGMRLQSVADQTAPEPADSPQPEELPETAEPAAHVPAATCVGWCPICRSADLLKGDRPELTQKLVDAALLVVTTLRSLIPPAPAPPTASNSSTDTDGSSGIERIDIR